MTMPTAAVDTANADAGTDSPQAWRSDALELTQKFNQLIDHVSPFAATLLDDADAAAARSTLSLSAPGNVAVVISGSLTVTATLSKIAFSTHDRAGSLTIDAGGGEVVFPAGGTAGFSGGVLIRNSDSVARTFRLAIMFNGNALNYLPDIAISAGGSMCIPVHYDSVFLLGQEARLGVAVQCTTTPAAGTCTALILPRMVFTQRATF